MCSPSSSGTSITGKLIRGDGAHGLFESASQLFAVGCGGVAWDPNRVVIVQFASGKGQGNMEAVPTGKADFPTGKAGDRNDGTARDLR